MIWQLYLDFSGEFLAAVLPVVAAFLAAGSLLG
ncbi:hypothetical protein JOD15_000104 [Enterococcus ureilyticus]|nr:hypothetical protein [Enterococcus ureilyticus]